MTEQQANHSETLNLQDLLVDVENDGLSDYLAISISNDGINTTVSVATVSENPDVYSTVLQGVAASDLSTLLNSSLPLIDDTT